MADETLTDFAVAAYLEDGRWEVTPLPLRAGQGIASLAAALRQLPAEGGALGLVSIGDDFCVIARTVGPALRLLLSDVTAAAEWPIAAEVLEAIGDEIDEDELDVVRPAGDLDIVADLGVSGLEMAAILGDVDAYPDEVLGRVAERLGFAEQFERAVETAVR